MYHFHEMKFFQNKIQSKIYSNYFITAELQRKMYYFIFPLITYEHAKDFFWKSDSSTTYSCYNLAKNQLPNTCFVKLTIFSKKGLSNLIQASMINKIYRFLTLYIPLVFKHLINSWPLNISSLFLHVYIYST